MGETDPRTRLVWLALLTVNLILWLLLIGALIGLARIVTR